jgi:hypothetical protein
MPRENDETICLIIRGFQYDTNFKGAGHERSNQSRDAKSLPSRMPPTAMLQLCFLLLEGDVDGMVQY